MVKVGSLFTQVLSLINRNDFARAVRPWGAARPRSQGLWSNFSSELVQDNRLEFRDFGVFEPRTREARVAQNPKTLEKVKVPAKRTVKFKIVYSNRLKRHQNEIFTFVLETEVPFDRILQSV